MKRLFKISSGEHGRGAVIVRWQPEGNFLATAGQNGESDRESGASGRVLVEYLEHDNFPFFICEKLIAAEQVAAAAAPALVAFIRAVAGVINIARDKIRPLALACLSMSDRPRSSDKRRRHPQTPYYHLCGQDTCTGIFFFGPLFAPPQLPTPTPCISAIK